MWFVAHRSRAFLVSKNTQFVFATCKARVSPILQQSAQKTWSLHSPNYEPNAKEKIGKLFRSKCKLHKFANVWKCQCLKTGLHSKLLSSIASFFWDLFSQSFYEKAILDRNVNKPKEAKLLELHINRRQFCKRVPLGGTSKMWPAMVCFHSDLAPFPPSWKTNLFRIF